MFQRYDQPLHRVFSATAFSQVYVRPSFTWPHQGATAASWLEVHVAHMQGENLPRRPRPKPWPPTPPDFLLALGRLLFRLLIRP
jgi:hypothetical protein